MVTIREVAVRAGVSISTVSHVINGTRFVDPETKQRVEEAIEELGYQPNTLARSLRRGTTNMLALIVPDNSNLYFAELARAIEDAGFAKGYGVVLCNSDNAEDKEEQYIRSLLHGKIDGFILISLTRESERLQMITEASIPVVVVDRRIDWIEVDQIFTDNEQGGYQAGQYLARLGHRRIGCISGPVDVMLSNDRLTGFRRALNEAGIWLEEEAIVASDFKVSGGQEAMRELLRRHLDLTAIFAVNDLMAIGAMHMLRQEEIRVPDDVSVIGFDNVALSAFVAPTLTTIAQPVRELGKQSVELLHKRMLSKQELPAAQVVLPTQLVERESCVSISYTRE